MKNSIIFLVVITLIFISLCIMSLFLGLNFTGIPIFIMLLYIAIKLSKIETNL